MDWLIFIGFTGLASLLTGIAAWTIARRLGAAGSELGFTPILLAILISAVVMLGAAKLAVAVDWAYGLSGVVTETALGGQFLIVAFAASFVPIAAYVVTFLLAYRKVRGSA
jgi:hypothetical protein